MEDLLNFCQITDDIGTAGQPDAGQIRRIADSGYGAVVNLAMHDSDNAIPEEGSLVASLGMMYFHIPVPFDRPSADHLKRFFGVMDALEGKKVLVHCAVNARVSAFMYQYLVLKKGASPEEATTPLLKKWRPEMDAAWKAILALQLDEIEATEEANE